MTIAELIREARESVRYQGGDRVDVVVDGEVIAHNVTVRRRGQQVYTRSGICYDALTGRRVGGPLDSRQHVRRVKLPGEPPADAKGLT